MDRTKLAESAGRGRAGARPEEFNKNFEDGPLDDPNHWIWDCAHEIACAFEQKRTDYLTNIANVKQIRTNI
jgi:hypothetical protein